MIDSAPTWTATVVSSNESYSAAKGELATNIAITAAANKRMPPAAIYVWLNWGDPIALDGWAIPIVTDIAFALALLSIFGSRVPIMLKVFLLTLAIFDDLAAIIIIAIFYSGDISLNANAKAISVATGIAQPSNAIGSPQFNQA